MATNFPTGLDALTNPTSTDALNSPSHADQHANVNDAVEALEAKVGVNGSAVTTSLDYKVENGVFPKLNVDSGVLFVDATNNRVGVNTASPTSDLTVSGSTTITGDLTVDTTTFKVDSVNNRVGVGTSSPTVALDVVGAGSITGDLTVDTNTLKVDSTNNRVGINNSSPTVALDVTGAGKISGNFTVDTDTLYVDSTNNRVGIGTASPSYQLDTTGTARLGGIYTDGSLTATNTVTFNPANNAFNLNANYGTIGIGTSADSTPVTRLTISGNTNVTGTITARTGSSTDGVALAGRAGGGASYEVTLTPTTLTADRTLTLQDKTGTVALTSDPGLIYITGTTVTSGTSSSVSFNNCFSSTYDNYRIVIDDFQPSIGSNALNYRLRSSGTDNSSTEYWGTYTGRYDDGSDAGAQYQLQTSGQTGIFNSLTTIPIGSAAFEVIAPFMSQRTMMTGTAILYNGKYGTRQFMSVHGLTTSYDGITFLLNGSGNITKVRIRIYGYRNS